MNEWSAFAKFYSVSEAESLISFLRSADIPFVVGNEPTHIEPIITGARLEPTVVVQIPANRFAEVNYLLSETPATELTTAPLADLKEERLATGWIVAGYILSFIPAIGLLAGIAITTAKRRQWNGEAMHIYDKRTRRHGANMIWLGMLSVVRFLIHDVAGFHF